MIENHTCKFLCHLLSSQRVSSKVFITSGGKLMVYSKYSCWCMSFLFLIDVGGRRGHLSQVRSCFLCGISISVLSFLEIT